MSTAARFESHLYSGLRARQERGKSLCYMGWIFFVDEKTCLAINHHFRESSDTGGDNGPRHLSGL